MRLATATSSSKSRPACSCLPTPNRQCARSPAKPGSASPRSTGTFPPASLSSTRSTAIRSRGSPTAPASYSPRFPRPRRWMELFGDWIAAKNGMLDTLLAMIESGEIAHAQTQTELLAAIDEILNAGRVTGELRADVTAEDIAASLIGIFTVARPPEHDARASRLLNILMDGLRSTP